MRILYVITKATGGGAQTYVYDLARAAREAGHDAAVAYGEPGDLSRRLGAAGIRTLPLRGLTRDVGLARELIALIELFRTFRAERPDVVHINSSKAGALGCLAARLAGTPRILFTAHGWAFNEERPWWQKTILFAASGVIVWLSHETICNSEATRRAIERFPFIRKKLVVIHNGIDCAPLLARENARAELSPPAIGKYWIGMISELHPTKRVEDAIEAMGIIIKKHPEAILIVMCEGEHRRALEMRVRDFQLRRHVCLAGDLRPTSGHRRPRPSTEAAALRRARQCESLL